MSSDFDSDPEDENSSVAEVLSDSPMVTVSDVTPVTNPSTPVDVTPTASINKSSKKRRSIKEKYPILSPCSCNKNCIGEIPQESRIISHDKFWEIESTYERKLWLKGNIKVDEKKSSKRPTMVPMAGKNPCSGFSAYKRASNAWPSM